MSLSQCLEAACFNLLVLCLDSPDYNGIESVVNLIKHQVKRMRLSKVLKGEEVDFSELVELAVEKVNE